MKIDNFKNSPKINDRKMINSSELKLGKSPAPIAFSQQNPAKSTSFESLGDIDGLTKKSVGNLGSTFRDITWNVPSARNSMRASYISKHFHFSFVWKYSTLYSTLHVTQNILRQKFLHDSKMIFWNMLIMKFSSEEVYNFITYPIKLLTIRSLGAENENS